jgi:AcrR family transcriptional regulator
MSPKPDVSEKRRNQILEAALKVFTKLGFQQARMDDIVEESGLSKGSLYWYFKNKDDIIYSTLERMLDNELKEVDKLVEQDKPTRELLMEAIEITIKDIKAFVPFIPLLLEILAMARRSKTVQNMFTTYYRRYMKSLIPLMQRGLDNGEFYSASAEEMSNAYGAIIEGTILVKMYSPDTIDLEHSMRESARLLIQGFQYKSDKEK